MCGAQDFVQVYASVVASNKQWEVLKYSLYSGEHAVNLTIFHTVH